MSDGKTWQEFLQRILSLIVVPVYIGAILDAEVFQRIYKCCIQGFKYATSQETVFCSGYFSFSWNVNA